MGKLGLGTVVLVRDVSAAGGQERVERVLPAGQDYIPAAAGHQPEVLREVETFAQNVIDAVVGQVIEAEIPGDAVQRLQGKQLAAEGERARTQKHRRPAAAPAAGKCPRTGRTGGLVLRPGTLARPNRRRTIRILTIRRRHRDLPFLTLDRPSAATATIRLPLSGLLLLNLHTLAYQVLASPASQRPRHDLLSL